MSNAYAAPTAKLSDVDTATQPVAFALNGRIGRLRYVAYSTAMYIIVTVVFLLVMIPLGTVGIFNAEDGRLLPILLLIVYMGFFTVIARRRLHDLGMSGWFVLGNFVPFVNFYFGLIMLFKRGDEGNNEFGAQLQENSLGVKIMAFSMPALVILFIIAAAMFPQP